MGLNPINGSRFVVLRIADSRSAAGFEVDGNGVDGIDEDEEKSA